MAHTLVFVELAGGAISDISLQCLGKAREAADSRVGCIAIGKGPADAAAQLAQRADWVSVLDGPEFEAYVQAPYRKALLAALAGQPADLLLFPASTLGNDLAPAVAEALGAACVLDADQAATDAS
ncbi:MAG: hypothetical protein U1E27_00080, partial [Kiritimatiellia bacterium]|nr:hypothetical protein [Kiritimatiellia bacterium]